MSERGGKKEVKLAAAAKIPIYLPLYIAQKDNFFDLLTNYEIKIEHWEGEKGTGEKDNGDDWAIDRLEIVSSVV